MRSARIAFSLLAVLLLVGLSGCTSTKSEDQQRVDEFLDRWGGKDPLAGINATMKMTSAQGLQGLCVSPSNDTKVDCHLISLELTNLDNDAVLLDPLAFEAKLENGQTVRAHYLFGPRSFTEGRHNYTVGFEFSEEHHVVSVRIGYSHSYVSTAVVSYTFTTFEPYQVALHNVLLHVDSANVVPGSCFEGVRDWHEECHVLDVSIDNRQGAELDSILFYWTAVDDNGIIHRCWDTSGDGIAAGVQAHLTVRFNMPEDSGVRLTDLRYDRHYFGLYGNASIPAYASDQLN